jgi:hypothetical protein
MGLWLKCPGCQAQNPLSLRVCPYCGQDLDKLPAAQRIYVIGPAAAPPPEPSPETTAPEAPKRPEKTAKAADTRSTTPSPEAGAAPKPAKQPKRTKTKKT